MHSGIRLPLVMPFRRGSVGIDALQYLADLYLRTEISGFVALGRRSSSPPGAAA
jgi:4-hydroxy-tetrahydrodipicolinate synthase